MASSAGSSADTQRALISRWPMRWRIRSVCWASSASRGGRIHDDREWHRIYSERRDQGLETLPSFDYPPNLEINAEVNHSWKQYIQRPSLLKQIAHLDRPALFLYGDRDIRPSWPVEQVAQLLPNASFQMIAGADHHIWTTHAEVMREGL